MRGAALAVLAASLAAAGGSAWAGPGAGAEVVVTFLEPTTLSAAVSSPLSGVLARAGGVGLLTAPGSGDPVAAARAALPTGVAVVDPSAVPGVVMDSAGPAMVLAVAPLRGPERKDLALLILARGDPDDVLAVRGPVRGLASETTRRTGLVSTADLEPTVLAFAGRPVPADATGSVIRVAGPAPSRLLERYRTLEPMRLPAGITVLAVALAGLLGGVALLFWPNAPAGLRRAVGSLGLAVAALPALLLVAVMLPRPTTSLVAAVTVVGAAAVAWGAWAVGRPEPAAALAVGAGVGMGVVILDGLLGWPGSLMPLIGGNAFEGSRFYGLGNQYGGVLLGGAVLAASRLRPMAGVALLFAVGLLAGLPSFGSNFGVAVTLFVAAGLWVALRALGGVRWRTAAAGAGLAAVGVAAVLLAHRFLTAVPTHVTRVVEGAERSGLGEIVRVYLHRLSLNLQGLVASPAAWLVVAALPVWLVVAWRRAGPFGPALARDPAWRDAVVVLAVASMAGFLANDTIGVAGMGFVYLSAAVVYPSLAMPRTRR